MRPPASNCLDGGWRRGAFLLPSRGKPTAARRFPRRAVLWGLNTRCTTTCDLTVT
nr:MAG TPA: hypothetical protein [Caudoviricetes sp.]